MWLRRLFARLNRWAAEKEVDPDDPLANLRVELAIADVELYASIPLSSACMLSFDCDYPNLDSFNHTLQYLGLCDLAVRKLELKDLGVNPSRVTLELFYYNSSGVRVDPKAGLSRFVTLSKTLLARWDEELNSNSVGIPGYNSRLVFSVLKQIEKLVILHRTIS